VGGLRIEAILGGVMTQSIYSKVVSDLLAASVPVRELKASTGCVAVTLAAGRVIAMAFDSDQPNLLWSHPHICDRELIDRNPGGFGGDRLWFGPELAYNWHGEPDWEDFSNYAPPPAMDPGTYAFLDDKNCSSVALQAQGELPYYDGAGSMGFEVYRSIRMAQSPVSTSDVMMRDVDYVGIEMSHVLSISEGTRAGTIDLWHLLQVPQGDVLIVPLNAGVDARTPRVLSYTQPGDWIEKPDHLMWRYGGESKAKMGISAVSLTGRSAVVRKLSADRRCLLVRQFPVDPTAHYGDHPFGVQRTDQAFQAWDGFGFGEMEFHSPIASAAEGPREIKELDYLWAFGGKSEAIITLASRLLGVEIDYLLDD
jgi:hypothetical protein